MTDVDKFLQQAKGKVLVAGYGSLLSHFSRQTYSQIESEGIAISVAHWQRSWITRSLGEQQTYVGAVPKVGAKLNAQLIALELDDGIQTREQDYRFSRLLPQDVSVDNWPSGDEKQIKRLLENNAMFICETLDVKPSNKKYPVNYSYIFTCLLGAYEVGGLQGVQDFLQQTDGWQNAYLFDDLANKQYPRHAIHSQSDVEALYPLLSSYLNFKN